MDVLAFYAFAAIAVLASLLVIGQGNPMHSVMLLIVSFGALAGLYVLLDAPFTAVTQIIVYAGAIMVLFLFVVMLLNLRSDDFAPARARLVRFGGALLGVYAVAAAMHRAGTLPAAPPLPEGFGGYRAVGIALYTDYVLLVEMASLLLTAAIVGALILAKRKID